MVASEKWQWENATAGAVAGFATVATMHPLDVVRTRFQGINFRNSFFFFFLIWYWIDFDSVGQLTTVEFPISRLTRTPLTRYSPLLAPRQVSGSSFFFFPPSLRVLNLIPLFYELYLDVCYRLVDLRCRVWEGFTLDFPPQLLGPQFHGLYISSCKYIQQWWLWVSLIWIFPVGCDFWIYMNPKKLLNL